jgi:hypothetical protein
MWWLEVLHYYFSKLKVIVEVLAYYNLRSLIIKMCILTVFINVMLNPYVLHLILYPF